MKIKGSLPGGPSGELDVSPKDLSSVHRFFRNITPDFVKVKFAILKDNAIFERWKNFVHITNEANKIAEKNNIKPLPLPLKDTVLFLDSASLEEDSTIQSMWANLLVNSMNSSNRTSIFISLLKELSPNDAKFLNYCFEVMKKRNFQKPTLIYLSIHNIQRDIKIEYPEFTIILNNLERLKLIQSPKIIRTPLMMSSFSHSSTHSSAIGGNDNGQAEIIRYLEDENRKIQASENNIQLTQLGFEFLKTCNEPNSK